LGGRQWLNGVADLDAARLPRFVGRTVEMKRSAASRELVDRDKGGRCLPHRRPAVRAGVVVLVEFHPDIVQRAISMQAVRFIAGSGKASRC
jgi:hypothetical protein